VALEVLGDSWSLLIVRDLMFGDRRTFSEFLAGGEGIASNILADRLRRLEAAGIIEKQPDPTDARRFVHRLTDKGLDLAPMLVELVLWSARHERTDAPQAVLRAMTTDRRAFIDTVRRRCRADAAAAATGGRSKLRGR
jgi:DNA-binding HxlR family transcriptional regulator